MTFFEQGIHSRLSDTDPQSAYKNPAQKEALTVV